MDVWVDVTNDGFQNGSYTDPFNTVGEGINRILSEPVSDIPVLHISPGDYAESVTFDRAMVVDTCGGAVIIGQQ